MITDFQLSNAGYGDIEVVRRFDARTYLQALAFEKFKKDFEGAYLEMHKKK